MVADVAPTPLLLTAVAGSSIGIAAEFAVTLGYVLEPQSVEFFDQFYLYLCVGMCLEQHAEYW